MTAPIIAPEILYETGECVGDGSSSTDQYLIKCLEAYEITNHILLNQNPGRTSLADRLGLPRIYPDEYCNTAMKLDACVDRWYKKPPPSLTPQVGTRRMLIASLIGARLFFIFGMYFSA